MNTTLRLVLAMALVAPALCAAQNADTPTATVEKFVRATLSGDAGAARALVIGEQADIEMVDALSNLGKAMRTLNEAAVRKWGDSANDLGTADVNESVRESLQGAKEQIDGDTALVSTTDGEATTGIKLKLRRTDGTWKIDLPANPDRQAMLSATPQFRVMSTAATEVAAEIDANKLPRPDDARRALADRILPTLTPPATQPGNP